jgi:hypothetical protein
LSGLAGAYNQFQNNQFNQGILSSIQQQQKSKDAQAWWNGTGPDWEF